MMHDCIETNLVSKGTLRDNLLNLKMMHDRYSETEDFGCRILMLIEMLMMELTKGVPDHNDIMNGWNFPCGCDKCEEL